MTTPARRSALGAVLTSSPVGPLAVIVRDGVVVASGFGTVEDARRMLPEDLADAELITGEGTAAVEAAVLAWAAGRLEELDTVMVDQPGGPFLQAVWRVMRQIPPGQTRSYSELAAEAGRPEAVRAVGQACARNRVAPFVPCHRVVRSDGSLGGYAYGLPVKRALLDFEGALESQPPGGQETLGF
jgi:methylated-DNA-[protein]-cysteine S-methyltransferase